MRSRKYTQTLDLNHYSELERMALDRGVTLQQVLRAVVIPEWMAGRDSPEPSREFVVAHGEGKRVHLGGVGVVFKVSGKDTNGAFSIVEHPLKPRTLARPHLHEGTDEFSFVVKGRVGVRIGDRIFDATPGCYVLKPRGIPHTFWNPGDSPARLVEVISPAGFEQFFDEASKLFLQGPPEVQKVAEVAKRYQTILGWEEWVPELTAKYKLRLFG